MSNFMGRQEELGRLEDLKKKSTASFVVVRGRRRIGKTRLINEFGGRFDRFYSFVGLAPDKKTTSQDQLDEFSSQMSRELQTYTANFTNWSDAFYTLGEKLRSGRVLLLFDEISWMGNKDHTFLAKIKNLWDLYLKKNDQLIFVICGSASSWIEKNIMQSTGFVGRISLTLTLDQLPLDVCRKFWNKNISSFEIFKVLSVTGGVPKYLEEINPKENAETNIKRLCFTKGGMLVDEFEQIFSNTFLRNSDGYLEILESLINGVKTARQILDVINKKHAGRIYEYLEELELAGFVTRDYTWDLKSAKDLKSSNYRLSDNYIRFYLKYIKPNINKISRGVYALKTLTALAEWNCIMGLQFENFVVNSREDIYALLNICPEDILNANPYFQKENTKRRGCQIDYMIQTKHGGLYICEIKFSKNEVDRSVISEVQGKIDALQIPRGISCRPVLIHVNGVSEGLIEEDYFAHIIDFSDVLASKN